MNAFKNYISSFFSGLSSLLKGMRVTIRVFFRKKTTEQYPENRDTLQIFDRFRGELVMPHNANNEHKCVACGICQMNCPNGSIKVISETVTDEEGKKKRVLTKYVYDIGKLSLLPALRAHLPARSDRVRQQVRACGLHARQTGASAQSRRFNVRKKIDGNGNYLATGRFCVSRCGDRRLFGDDGDHEADSASCHISAFRAFATAGIYFQLNYSFLGAVQLLIYAGGVVVLYVFSILLTSSDEEKKTPLRNRRVVAGLAASVAGAVLCIFLLVTHSFGPSQFAGGEIDMHTIGHAMMGTGKYQYLLPFEAVSGALLACIVGGC